MSFIFGFLAVLCALFGIYLFLDDAELTVQLGAWWNSVLTLIDSSNGTYAKGLILLGLAVVFAVVAVIFDRQKRGVTDPAK